MTVIETSLPRNGNFTRRSKITAVVLHHAEASRASVEDINRWHLERGWTGIGYHYYIRKDGKVYRGRPEWALGAHAQGANDYSIGICCEGGYMTETMPAAQLASLKALIRDIMQRYGTLELLRHKDVGSTDCPGDKFPWTEAQRYNEKEPEMTQEQFEAMYNKVNPMYTSVAAVPEYWRAEAKELMQCGAIKGDGKTDIAIRADALQAAIVAYRAAVAK